MHVKQNGLYTIISVSDRHDDLWICWCLFTNCLFPWAGGCRKECWNIHRETNENTNGLLREYFPKGQDLTDISEEYIQSVFDKPE